MARTLALALLCGTAAAFGGPRRAARPRRRTALNGETVRVKFRIYPDGRVEETVSGIRGSDCTKVTEELNEKLGKVTQTKPCLLYTSPSPRDRQKSRMPSSA